ncbi:membrane protein of unknown function [uncultured Sphingopyxis sp.]|uniref:Uncharacterized protein n=1 Tax=uncultured Sphingopyxis sp. TaxID=310581 RepID=A0A1Y5PRR4_9SPHN|nr:hypothetical protein [uncultured Sphingopyxis sp.]SBV32692.1 membrane protein of unknown function [uncultured Sphingopyxis sp.]
MIENAVPIFGPQLVAPGLVVNMLGGARCVRRVAVAMLVMRRRAPLAWITGPAAIIGCLFLFLSLPRSTQILFLGWNVAVALIYSVRRRF